MTRSLVWFEEAWPNLKQEAASGERQKMRSKRACVFFVCRPSEPIPRFPRFVVRMKQCHVHTHTLVLTLPLCYASWDIFLASPNGHPARPAAPDLCRQAAGRRPHAGPTPRRLVVRGRHGCPHSSLENIPLLHRHRPLRDSGARVPGRHRKTAPNRPVPQTPRRTGAAAVAPARPSAETDTAVAAAVPLWARRGPARSDVQPASRGKGKSRRGSGGQIQGTHTCNHV